MKLKKLKEIFLNEEQNQKVSPFTEFTIELKKILKTEPGKPEGWRARIVKAELEPEHKRSGVDPMQSYGLGIASAATPSDALLELAEKLEKIQYKGSGKGIGTATKTFKTPIK